MSFCISTRDICYIADYAAARKHFDETNPFKGSDERPLAARRKRHISMRKWNGGIDCCLYNSPLVSYYPNGEIHVATGGYNTNSSATFISTISPWHCVRRYGRLYLVVKKQCFILSKEPLRIFDGEVTNPAQGTCRVLNKQRAAEVRKVLRPLFAYIKALFAMNEGKAFAYEDENFSLYRMMLAAREGNVIAALSCISNYNLFQYSSAERPGWRERILKEAYETEKCFDEVPVPIGELPPRPGKYCA